MSKNKNVGIIGILMFLVALIALFANLGRFKTANVVTSKAFYDESSCPDSVYSFFDLTLDNTGERDTSVCLTAWSNEINISSKPTCYLLEYDSPNGAKFRIETGTSPYSYKEKGSLTINYKYEYDTGGLFSKHILISDSCKYEKKEYSNSLSLIE